MLHGISIYCIAPAEGQVQEQTSYFITSGTLLSPPAEALTIWHCLIQSECHPASMAWQDRREIMARR